MQHCALVLLHVNFYSNHQTIMENQEMKTEGSVVSAAPTCDTKDRLAAAREYAVAQYEKIRRAAAVQFDHVRKYTADARQQINAGWDATCSNAKKLHTAGEEFVKEHPTGSVLGSLGVGLIIGLLLGCTRR